MDNPNKKKRGEEPENRLQWWKLPVFFFIKLEFLVNWFLKNSTDIFFCKIFYTASKFRIW